MQQAIAYKSWLPIHSRNSNINFITHGNNSLMRQGEMVVKGDDEETLVSIRNTVSENAVIVFGKRGCCMSHVVKRLLLGHGVNPAVYEVDEEDEVRVVNELQTLGGGGGNNRSDGGVQFPAVFIGGRLFGGLDRVMATHISGELVPILKEAGALWL